MVSWHTGGMTMIPPNYCRETNDLGVSREDLFPGMNGRNYLPFNLPSDQHPLNVFKSDFILFEMPKHDAIIGT